MDPNVTSQQWQQQYPNPNQQYAQSSQQQYIGTLQYDHSSAAQQTPYESQFAQQGVSQPPYQGLMQQVPTQQSSPNASLHQQSSYQQFSLGNGNVIPASLAPVGPWTQTQPISQWPTATNNATTTTTTTTTTTKSTKETQASQPQSITSSTALDFSSLIQQAPQQQPVQQQQAFNYSQTMQSGNQQQTLLPPAPDFSQLMQNNPPPAQVTLDFSQLLQTAPPPQPQVSQAPPVVQMPIVPVPAKSSKKASKSSKNLTINSTNNSTETSAHNSAHNSANNSTNNSTTTTTTTVVGSTSRQRAAGRGQRELRRFDREVNNRLKQHRGICPMEWDYYATRQGYLCGGTNHFVSHDHVEALLSNGRPPYIEFVNGPSYTRLVTPPPATGQLDGCGELPVWEADPGWWERHKWRVGLDKSHPLAYPF